MKASRCANSTPLVPIEVGTDPSRTTPTPTAAAALSPPPAATGSAQAQLVGHLVAQRPGHRRPLEHLRHHGRGISSASRISSDQSRARTSSSSVPERVGGVGAPFAGQHEATWSFRQQHARHARVGVGLLVAHSQDLQGLEPGQRRVAGQLEQPLGADRAVISSHCAAIALVIPEQRG